MDTKTATHSPNGWTETQLAEFRQEEELDERNRIVHEQLRLLRADEAMALSNTAAVQKRRKKKQEGFFTFTSKEISRYIHYLIKTWSTSIRRVLFGGSVHPAEILPIFIFAGISSFILLLLLCYCIYVRIPSRHLTLWKKEAEDRHAPSMFESINQEQVDAAKRALEKNIKQSPTNQRVRVFNLDIAKLCCQLSALMYQHDNNHSLDVMEDIQQRKALHNASDKSQQLRAKLNAMGLGVASINEGIESGYRSFTSDVEDPGALVKELLGGDHDDAHCAAKKLGEDLSGSSGDSEIARFCRTFDIEYAPVSELNSSSAAYSSIFWDKASNWIILAFKGTGPEDFAEWMTDLDYTLVHGGSWLKGFGRVHGGFAERIFPRDVKELGGRRPYDTIASAIKIVAKDLVQNGKGEVNVYFTGHSLGTAIASLTYARAISGKRDFGKNVIVRDAYLFATPIICDVPSVHAFNFAMFKNLSVPRTMWRISNRNDLVATGLPEQGDRAVVSNPNSLFCFAHLGTEIRLVDKLGEPCFASGSHVTQGTHVKIQSEFSDDDLYRQRQEGLIAGNFHDYLDGTKESDPLLDVPVIGSVLAHGVGYYWESLSKVSNGACVWVDD